MNRQRGSGASFTWGQLGMAAAIVFAAADCGPNKAEFGPAAGSGGWSGVAGQNGARPDGGTAAGGATGGDELCSGEAGGRGPLVRMIPPTFPVDQGQAANPPPPISGGTLIVLGDGVTVVASDPDRDLVYVVDVSNLDAPSVRHTIALAPHDEPGRLIEDGAGKVHVALRNRASLVTIDPAAGTIGLRRSVCALPRGLAYDPATDRIHLACAGGQLLTFAPTSDTPERTLNLDQDLRDVVVDGDRLLVSRFRSAQVMVVGRDGTVGERVSLAPFKSDVVHKGNVFEPGVAWRMVGKRGGGAAMVHQRGMHGKVDRQPGGYGGPSCDGIVHTSVSVVKSQTAPVAGPAMPGFVLPVDIALSPDGTRVAMVAAGNGHVDGGSHRVFVSGLDDVALEWGGGCGNDGHHGPSSGSCLGPRTVSSRGSGGVGGATAAGGAGGATPAGGAGGATPAGGAGGSAGIGGQGVVGGVDVCSDLPVNVEPTAVAFVGPNAIVVQSREPAQLWVLRNLDATTGTTLPPATSISLSDVPRGDLGHTVFHSNSGGGLACASCHPEGHEDGRVWSFACEGDRRTQDIAGGLSGTEPFHWSGDLGNFSALVNTVFVGRMSGPVLTADQSDTMMHWIDSVPALPPLRSPAEAQVARGKALFNDPAVGCATCHSGNLLTNNTTVDVGTAGAFQVPALRGLGWRAPYMHNGCAPDLVARFTSAACGGGDVHGKTSQLTETERDDLIAFLQSL